MNKIAFIVSLYLFTGCASLFNQPMKVSEARLGAPTPFYEELTGLPTPKEKIVAAVYKFRDQTGQYKLTETGASWSTVVTQGATSILIEAMEESGWFIPIEREGLSNLLNERKIIRSSRMQYLSQNETEDALLPPLLFAGVILEGGIISFDSNIRTGGAGLRYFGAGASGQYREDRVTIYLRAVSTSNGRILKTVYITKSILSQKLDVGFFRYVKFKRLLEAETGYTYNEPSEIAVKEAIEKALYALVVEGIHEELWELENQEDINSPIFTSYFEEKALNENTNYLGFSRNYHRKFFSVGIEGGGLYLEGDYPGTEPTGVGNFSFGFFQNSPVSFSVNIGRGDLGGGPYFSSMMNFSEVIGKYRFLNHNKYTPCILFGSGVMSAHQLDFFDVDFSNRAYPYLNIGIGYDYLFENNLEWNVSFSNSVLFNDRFDAVNQGNYSDYYWGLKLGIRYYLTIRRK